MRTIVILISLFIGLLNANCFSQTNIPGGVVSGTWTKVNSPYLVNGAIMIANGSTLTIQPGVSVEFQGDYKFLVLGQLLASGLVNDSITFTAADTTAGWLGIRFDSTLVTNDTSRFSFCKFKYGKANGTSAIIHGGAMYLNKFSKVNISNSLFTNCRANMWGGGIYCRVSNAIISNNTFIHNFANWGGGGIYFENGDPTIVNNQFSHNAVSIANVARGSGICCYSSNGAFIAYNMFLNNSSFRGGGVFTSGGGPTISHNSFIGNKATADGAAVECELSDALISYNTFSANIGSVIGCESKSPIISYNLITNNNGVGIHCFNNNSNYIPTISNNSIVNNNGSGISCSIVNPVILNNVISNNQGSGIYCFSFQGQISNNSITNNTASSFGGGIFCNNSSPGITNNTIANNFASKGGALYCTGSSSPNLKNINMWGDSAATGKEVYIDDQPSKPNISYSNIRGGSVVFGLNTNVFYLGTYTNNINSDPLFASPSGGAGNGYNGVSAGWSLQSGSPCIDAGDPAGTYPATDIAGNPRISNNLIDIGAFENQNNVGIESLSFRNNLIVYPNPFFKEASWKSETPFKNATLTVTDYIGNTVKQIKNISGFSFTFDRTDLISGLYFFSLEEETKLLAVEKMVITDN